MSEKQDKIWMQSHFPTTHAREAADRAVDRLDPSLPMTAFLDAWVAAYIRAGGRTPYPLG